MKRLTLLFVFCITTLSASAYTTEASKFVEEQYAKKFTSQPKINVKKEHTEEYQQKIGDQMIPAITYGYGDMKVKGEIALCMA